MEKSDSDHAKEGRLPFQVVFNRGTDRIVHMGYTHTIPRVGESIRVPEYPEARSVVVREVTYDFNGETITGATLHCEVNNAN